MDGPQDTLALLAHTITDNHITVQKLWLETLILSFQRSQASNTIRYNSSPTLILLAAFLITLAFEVGLDSIERRMEMTAPTSMMASYDCIMLQDFSKPRMCMMNSFFFSANHEEMSSNFSLSLESSPSEGLKTRLSLILAILLGVLSTASTDSQIQSFKSSSVSQLQEMISYIFSMMASSSMSTNSPHTLPMSSANSPMTGMFFANSLMEETVCRDLLKVEWLIFSPLPTMPADISMQPLRQPLRIQQSCLPYCQSGILPQLQSCYSLSLRFTLWGRYRSFSLISLESCLSRATSFCSLSICLLCSIISCLASYINLWMVLQSWRDSQGLGVSLGFSFLISVMILDMAYSSAFCTFSSTLEQRGWSLGSLLISVMICFLKSLMGVMRQAQWLSWLNMYFRLSTFSPSLFRFQRSGVRSYMAARSKSSFASAILWRFIRIDARLRRMRGDRLFVSSLALFANTTAYEFLLSFSKVTAISLQRLQLLF